MMRRPMRAQPVRPRLPDAGILAGPEDCLPTPLGAAAA